MNESRKLTESSNVRSPTSWEKLLSIARIILSLPFLPIIFIKTYINECKHEKENEKTVNYAQSDTALERQFQEIPIMIIPLSEFRRTKIEIPEIKEPKNCYMLIYLVAFDARTAPVFSEVLPPHPLLPNLRLINEPFITDFASIPFSSPTGSYNRAAVIHDWGYSHYPQRNRAGRDICDQTMLHIMREDTTTPFVRSIIYTGLYIGGEWAFIHAPKKRNDLRKIYKNKKFIEKFYEARAAILTYSGTHLERLGFLNTGWREETLKQVIANSPDANANLQTHLNEMLYDTRVKNTI